LPSALSDTALDASTNGPGRSFRLLFRVRIELEHPGPHIISLASNERTKDGGNMKTSVVLALCLTLAPIGVNAQASKTNVSAAAKIDPAKEADIRRLLDLVGAKALIEQTMDSMSKSIKPLLTNSLPPGEYREKLVDLFFAKFSAKADVQHMLDLAVPVYDKNFSHQEIRSLIEFYQTPLGQKAIATLPKVSAEMQEQGRKWGEDLGRQCMVEVLSEHPELADALNAAQSNTQSANK
jgi:uncharacterized protein